MSNKLLELLEKIENFIAETWLKMVDWGCAFHELIMANGRSLKPTKLEIL
jgi:hypothetical protein